MGGTCTDVALLAGGQCRLAERGGGARLSDQGADAGHPHGRAPAAARSPIVDSGGLLKVGPRSAGADPGPVCYGRGNDEPTVTDANVVLQTLNPRICWAAAWRCAATWPRRRSAGWRQRLGLDADGRRRRASSPSSPPTWRGRSASSRVQRGYDPRDYTLMAFGGAGPLHAARLARELDIGRILVPRNPGILCAMGLLLTDLRADFAADPADHAGRRRRCPRSQAAFDGAAGPGRGLVRAGGDRRRARRRITRTVDMRYAGQNYELPVALPDGPIGAGDARGAGRRLRRGASAACTASSPRASRCSWSPSASRRRASSPRPSFQPQPDAGPDAAARRHRQRARSGCRRPAASSSCPVYDRDRLRARQPHRRPGDRRADGRHHGRPARHDGARRALSQPDPGGR